MFNQFLNLWLWGQTVLRNPKILQGDRKPHITIPPRWEILGPFQIGTREATWGADPLEYFGGFRNLKYDEQSYHSSLGKNGSVKWSIRDQCDVVQTEDAVDTTFTIDFPAIDWEFLQSFYGWAALQYQAWARGSIVIEDKIKKTVVFYTDNVLEFYIDGQCYFGGDFYAYRRAPLVLHLAPGVHQIDLRLIRDVRAMGGVGKPTIQVSLKAELSSSNLAVQEDRLLLPEIVEDPETYQSKLSSHLASLPIRNEGNRWIEIIRLESLDNAYRVSILETMGYVGLAPGQSRPLAINLYARGIVPTHMSFRIAYCTRGSSSMLYSLPISSKLSIRRINETQRVTFLHPSGIVSYAILRPPTGNFGSGKSPPESLPILLNMHGAGLEADSEQVRHMLDPVSDLEAWVLFPTGVTPWSGDDWRKSAREPPHMSITDASSDVWGFADVEAAVTAVPEWIIATAWKGPKASINRYFVSGHSNGGQGTWYALTHRPDKVIAAASVSGYSSIQAYVPYTFWHVADPRVTSILQMSLASYRHELLIDNFAGIPVWQQHGADDDNVPAYHSRRLSQLTAQSGSPSQYFELPKRGHWFEGVMTTEPLREFYKSIPKLDGTQVELPTQFLLVAFTTGGMSSRGGIVIDQLVTPDQLGKIEVKQDTSLSWTLKTSNIRRFHLSFQNFHGEVPKSLHVDNSHFPSLLVIEDFEHTWFIQGANGSWERSLDQGWQSECERHGTQFGALEAILRSRGRIVIRHTEAQVFDVALQVARNLFQYYAADSEIQQSTALDESKSNVVSILQGPKVTFISKIHPISIVPDQGISIRTSEGFERHYALTQGLGAIFLKQLPEERLELVIWGADGAGLRYASRLVPMLTGVGQPDFIIVSKECSWKGAAGVLAMGFLDYSWNISQSSFTS